MFSYCVARQIRAAVLKDSHPMKFVKVIAILLLLSIGLLISKEYIEENFFSKRFAIINCQFYFDERNIAMVWAKLFCISTEGL